MMDRRSGTTHEADRNGARDTDRGGLTTRLHATALAMSLVLGGAGAALAQEDRPGRTRTLDPALPTAGTVVGARSPFALVGPDFARPDDRFSRFGEPRVSGDRTLSVRVRDLTLDQDRPLSRDPRAGRVRVELEYRADDEAWSRDRRLVPAVRIEGVRRGVGVRLEAILPQAPLLTGRAAVGAPRGRSPAFSLRPVTFAPGDVVHYRWVLRDASGRVFRQPARRFLMPRPFTVAIMGDSFGAGEGAANVDKPFPLKPASSADVPIDLLSGLGTPGFENFARWEGWETRGEADVSRARGAHRSRHSGLVQGLELFERRWPEVWVKSLHTAISGATIGPGGGDDPNAQGMLTGFTGGREIFLGTTLTDNIARVMLDFENKLELVHAEDNALPPQLTVLERWIATEGTGYADLVLLSAGGNDAGFGDIITSAITGSLTLAFTRTQRLFRGGLEDTVPAADLMLSGFDDIVFPRDRRRFVLWANYPNLTRDENGRHAGLWQLPQTIDIGGQIAGAFGRGVVGGLLGAVLSPFTAASELAAAKARYERELIERNLNPGILALTLTMSARDMALAESLLLDELNPAIERWCGRRDEDARGMAAESATCDRVDIAQRSRRHGLPATRGERWFNTFLDSTRERCGGMDCSVHPNATGFREIYAEPFAAAIEEKYKAVIGDEALNPVDLTRLPSPDAAMIAALAASREARAEALRASLPRRDSLREMLLDLDPELRLAADKVDDIVRYLKRVDPESVGPFLAAMKRR